MKRVQKKAERYVYRGRVVNLRVDTLFFPDTGRTVDFEVVEYAPAVTILPVTRDRNIVFTRQYRHALGRTILELPAGKCDHGEENTLEAARRELAEETGYRAGSWEFLLSYYVAPGYSTERMSFWIARDLEPGDQNLDPDEVLEVEEIPEEEVLTMLLSGQFEDAKTIIGLTYYFLRKHLSDHGS